MDIDNTITYYKLSLLPKFFCKCSLRTKSSVRTFFSARKHGHLLVIFLKSYAKRKTKRSCHICRIFISFRKIYTYLALNWNFLAELTWNSSRCERIFKNTLKKIPKTFKNNISRKRVKCMRTKRKHNVTSLEWNALAEFRQSILKESQHS